MTPPPIAIIVQARCSSTRLPGKVLKPLAGAPAIVRMMERVNRVGPARWRIVATSDDPDDDDLARVCADAGIEVVRGPLDDVLGRFVMATPDDAVGVVRLTGDCPLIDPQLVTDAVECFLDAEPPPDYVTNAVERMWPDGLDVEVIRPQMLRDAHRHATAAADREHVTPWVRRHARSVRHLPGPPGGADLSPIRWTLDTTDDYDVIAAIFEALWPDHPHFDRYDVARLLIARPDLIRIAGQPVLADADRAGWVDRLRDVTNREPAT